MTLLSLWEPVWARSSRFSRTRTPSSLGQAAALGDRGGPAAVVAEDRVELGPEGRVGPGVAERGLELDAGGHQRLGDVAPAEVAEAAGRARVAHDGVGGGGLGGHRAWLAVGVGWVEGCGSAAGRPGAGPVRGVGAVRRAASCVVLPVEQVGGPADARSAPVVGAGAVGRARRPPGGPPRGRPR